MDQSGKERSRGDSCLLARGAFTWAGEQGMGESISGDRPGLVSPSELRVLVDTLRAVPEGAILADIAQESSDATVRELRVALRRILATADVKLRSQRRHAIDLAMGLSECFQVLTEVKRGNLEARVGQKTVSSKDELMSNLATSINQAIASLAAQMETVRKQQHAIHELSTPILQLWDDILVLPIIGVVDSRRSAEIMERLLAEIVARQSHYVILDLTGVELVDTRTADHFIKVIRAAELLGASCCLTGIRPAVAQTLVEIGVDLSSIATMRNLDEALKDCIRRKRQDRVGASPAKMFNSKGPDAN